MTTVKVEKCCNLPFSPLTSFDQLADRPRASGDEITIKTSRIFPFFFVTNSLRFFYLKMNYLREWKQKNSFSRSLIRKIERSKNYFYRTRVGAAHENLFIMIRSSHSLLLLCFELFCLLVIWQRLIYKHTEKLSLVLHAELCRFNSERFVCFHTSCRDIDSHHSRRVQPCLHLSWCPSRSFYVQMSTRWLALFRF